MITAAMTQPVHVIADDVTGATDIGDALADTGRSVIVLVGVPRSGMPVGPFDALVVALKTRTAPVEAAVAESLAAHDWLAERENGRLIFKVCSTFDSTPRGNIGPVADALLDRLGARLGIVCPATPANGRTIYMGHLFVGDRLLHETAMADHPLTPMRESDVVRLLAQQSTKPVGLVPYPAVRRGADAIRASLAEQRGDDTARYLVIDALGAEDLAEIVAASDDAGLWIAASGLATGLPRLPGRSARPLPSKEAPAAVLAGSSSAATRRQVEEFARTAPALHLDASLLVTDPGYAPKIVRMAVDHVRGSNRVLVYATARAEDVARAQQLRPAGEVAAQVEEALARAAVELVERAGVRRLVVAGGETSGAVLRALGVTAMAVGPTIAPGVPWMVSVEPPGLSLALKSGNFGGPRFFTDALDGHE